MFMFFKATVTIIDPISSKNEQMNGPQQTAYNLILETKNLSIFFNIEQVNFRMTLVIYAAI